MPISTASNETLARMLERNQLLPSDVINGLLNRARARQQWIGAIAVEDGMLSYQEVARVLAKETHFPLANLKMATPDPRALSLLPLEFCQQYVILPIGYDSHAFYLAMANPLDDAAKLAVHDLVKADLNIQVAQLNELTSAIPEWYARVKQQNGGDAPSRITDIPKATDLPPTPSLVPTDDILVEDLLVMMCDANASDLHLAVGSPPLMRVDGELQSMPFPVLRPPLVQTLIYSILTDIQITAYERHWELDFSYSLPRYSRFRVNVHRQRGSVGAVFRMIPATTPTLEKLKMPPIVRDLTLRPRGLVLVTGPTGSGKSTTLAAMVDEINRTKRTHIVTVEDPIEFLHNNKLSVITQREVGSDTESFSIALRHVLRQDPDVILIGEMRDLETISAALTAAETGHLVFATLHTTSAAQTIDRIVDVFPEHQQDQVRTQLANVLEGIITQTLLQHIDGHGRSCAQEIMLGTPAIRTLIRDNKVHQMPSVIQSSGKFGMQTLDQALRNLVLNKQVSVEEAMTKTPNADDFKSLLAMQ